MAKFSQIARGTRARKKGVECTTLEGVAFVCDLRVLDADEEGQCLAAACKNARDSGGSPVETDLNYQFAFAREIVALAAVDPESSDDNPLPFFDGMCPDGKRISPSEQVRKNLDRERILLIAGIHRRFQEQTSPVKHDLSPEEFIALVITTAATEEGEDLPFETLPRFTRNRFIRTMAVQLLTSPPDKSLTGSGEEVEATH